MLRFKQFIIEVAQASAADGKHLEHPEDRVLDHGKQGAQHAIDTLHNLHATIHGHGGGRTTQKMDGAPAVFFGRHPETGKFFVGTKSIFNKAPKINYTAKDIENNHGHAPGLVDKLKAALTHLPKVTPKHGVYQGDIMHGGADELEDDSHSIHHTPNTITYSAHRHSRYAQDATSSRIGVAVHTRWEPSPEGKLDDKAIPHHDVDHHNFRPDEDVHNISADHDHTGTHMDDDTHAEFQHHIKKAQELTNKLTGRDQAAIKQHADHMKIFINSRVRNGTFDSHHTAADYKEFLRDRSKPKSDSSAAKATAKKAKALLDHHESDETVAAAHHNALAIHHHVKMAKNALVRSMNNHVASGETEVRQSINGVPSAPEGYVHHHKGAPTKIVDRNEFAQANFNAGKPGAK